MSKSVHLWILHVPVCVTVFYSFFILPIWTIPLFIISGCALTCLFVEAGLHRYFSHQPGKFKYKFLHKFFVIGCSLIAQGPIPIWVTSHRVHHKFSDTPKDTHSPKQHGIRDTFFAHWFIWKMDDSMQITRILGLLYQKDKLVRFLTDHYIKINIAFAVILYLISPYLFIFWCYVVLMGLIGSGTTNTIGHLYGEYTDFPAVDKSLFWTATAFHGTHHKQPTRVHYNEFLDPAGWILKKILV